MVRFGGGTLLFRAEFLHSTIQDAGNCHAATITLGPAGELLVAWYVYPEKETEGGQIVLGRQDAGDGSWGKARPIDLGTSSSLGNPVVFFDPSGVLWIHFALLRGLYWDRSVWCAVSSTDGGRSFTPTTVISDEEGRMIRHPPLFLPSGKAIMPTYCDRTKTTQLYESSPPYTEWRPGHHFEGSPLIQPALIAHGGKLVLIFRPSSDLRVASRSISSDDGQSWSSPVRLPLPNPLSGLDAFSWGNRIVAVYNHTEKHQRFPLSLALSDGLMHEWTSPIDFEQAQFEVSYPSFCTDSDDVVHGVYTFNRKLIKYVSFDNEWVAENHG